ncbi:hypothetical protein RGR602_CH03335 [Rhizobium gallicum bv. gallicum R602sp]|uniref:Uncharacterized protein n=1 Tax=Rhizobium gallicum bv. gallicum R602sp TaxID=1041138 RepID=A0A0B4X3D6_9HYPH|nr:hypothetical protein RGR602_CH03335 [Rhizobium gallicum bv. gallicum R602sp]
MSLFICCQSRFLIVCVRGTLLVRPVNSRDDRFYCHMEEHKMSLQELLPLDDSRIDMVTTVVHQWCKCHHVPIESGRVAMTTAISLALGGEHSSKALAEAVGRLCGSSSTSGR